MWGVTTFIQVLTTRPDQNFKEILAWNLSGFPSSPLPVYICFCTKETAAISGPIAHLEVVPKSQLSDGISADPSL